MVSTTDPFSAMDPAGIVQLLDEHHLVVVGSTRDIRRRWISGLTSRIECLEGTRIIHLDSGTDPSLAGLLQQLDRALPQLRIRPRNMSGLVRAFQRLTTADRRMFILWENADGMLEDNVELFGEVADTLLSSAVQHEYLSDDRLTLDRVVFTGGDKLGAYAEEDGGQFRSWRTTASEPGGATIEVRTINRRPRVLVFRLDG
jgi:hypothetical protein